MKSNVRMRLLASTLIAGMTVAAPAFAQTNDDPQSNSVSSVQDPTAGEGTESIVVTGTRIRRPDLVSTSPLAVVDDEEFQLSGSVNAEQVINTLPQVVPGSTAFSNNPGGGVSTLNLRGIGATRTLVLVNGRRYVSYDTSQVVDINTIPTFLLSGVDVITGGASAVYGSDALAGVVNFRLRDDLNGITAGANYNITERGDGRRYGANVAIGTQFADNRGHVTVFGEYYKRDSLLQGARGFSNQALGDGATGLIPLGSATTNRGRIAAAGSQVIPAGNGLAQITLPRGAGNFGTALGANFGNPGVSTAYNSTTDAYNYAVDNYLMVPQERYLLGGYGSYEISPAVTAYAEVTFTNNRVANELAPTPVTGSFNVNVAQQQQFLSAADFAALQQIDINETAINAARTARGLGPLFTGANAASNAAGVVNLSINRRVNETGSRNALDERSAFRLLTGIKGPLFGDFTYDAYYSYARTRNANVQAGNISRSAFQRGLDGTDAAINVFGPGTLTPAMVDQISILAQNGDVSVLQVASAAGTLGNLGMGAGDLGLALGVEYRKVSSQFIPDTALSSGDVIGFNGGLPTSGSYNVKEVFGELDLPIIADQPFFYRLNINGAARYSDYSLGAVGGAFTWKAGGEWAPVRDLTIRGSYQRAIRAPNVGELFGGASNGFPGATDPCSSRNTTNQTATVRTLCEQTGVPAALVFTTGIQPNAQIEGQFGGNPALQEEKSDSWTVGAVIQPSFIPRLNVTVDYFKIKVDDYISTFGGGLNNTLNLCYNQIQNINSVYCQAVVRDPSTGQIGGEFLPLILNANVASIKTSGIDVQVDYGVPLGFGFLNETSNLNFFFLGTWTEENTFTPVVDQPDIRTDCAGRFGQSVCGNPQPKYKWTSRLSFIDGPMTTSVRWRHLGKVRDDDDSTDYIVERLGTKDYIDLSFALNVTDQFTLSAGVNNLFDIQPQLIGDNQEQANTYPGVYDPLGRDYFVAVRFAF
ncbi:TonB-dependent receptor [Sphingomonas sp. NBWT7]|uniref:TonB-dependent receptor domain-containing protein n=1 Tax=Sphingomonas sp. NBWT7 TaxID=2596913 RepID=UPI0016289A78|nr:TonB-dependent receptor [Sphingomonas sp. NBWT7]QNE32282.1 TonB-dependent receptor [Sphingomonas sp. NBWT7]